MPGVLAIPAQPRRRPCRRGAVRAGLEGARAADLGGRLRVGVGLKDQTHGLGNLLPSLRRSRRPPDAVERVLLGGDL
eukprot:4532105-Alexandrium_andersonii.AAC.1